MTAAEIIASDISAEALSVAKRNAAKNGAQVSFDCGDLFHPFQKELRKTRFDMVVSNPPYIPSADISGLQTEVRDYEPHLALDGGPDGLAFYKRIVREAPDFLKKNGSLLLEIGFDQADAVTEMAALDGRYCGVRICKDLAGLDRIAVLTLL